MGQLRRPTIHPLPRLARRVGRFVLRQIKLLNWFHRFRLTGPHPIRLLAVPEDPRPGDPVRGTRLLTGRFVEGGQILTKPDGVGIAAESWEPEELWTARRITSGWRARLHSFGWLRDLDAVSDRISAKRRAEEFVRAWLEHHDRWQSFAWDPDILARRIIVWMCHAPLILSNKDHIYRSRVLNSLARQARHLARRIDDAEPGPARMITIIGLCYAGLFLPQGGARLKHGIQLLERELAETVLPDGGIATRSPREALELFIDLKGLARAFERSREPMPEGILTALDRLAPAIRALTHGDGHLALFNGSYEERDHDVARILGDDYGGMAPHDNGRHSGFQRLAREQTIVIVDAGPPSPLPYSRNNHAGTLSFEMSVGDERLIVNCGSLTSLHDPEATPLKGVTVAELNLMARATAAHSTLVMNDTNSAEVLENGLIGDGPGVVEFDRREDGGAVWLEAMHDGYRRRYGYDHRRRLYLSPDGNDFRGEDVLINRTRRRRPLKFDVRFHLHPDVKVTAEDGEEDTFLLETDEGQRFRFRARGGHAALDDSIYLGRRDRPQRSSQIVITGNLQPQETVVNWSIRRVKDDEA